MHELFFTYKGKSKSTLAQNKAKNVFTCQTLHDRAQAYFHRTSFCSKWCVTSCRSGKFSFSQTIA